MAPSRGHQYTALHNTFLHTALQRLIISSEMEIHGDPKMGPVERLRSKRNLIFLREFLPKLLFRI